jgi:protein involved in polysaccharide export with SLBB domain
MRNAARAAAASATSVGRCGDRDALTSNLARSFDKHRLRFLVWAASLLLAATVAERATAQSTPPGDSTAHAPSALRPGDVVRVRIWREPDLSGDFMVNESGVVTLPKAGPVHVGGLSVSDLRSAVTAAYEGWLNHSSIEVTLLRRIQVVGAVRTPGLYTVDPTMTVGDALALAGGVTTPGRPHHHVQVVREGKPLNVTLSWESPIVTSPLRPGDQLYVPGRGWFSRNATLIVAAVSATASLVWALRVF